MRFVFIFSILLGLSAWANSVDVIVVGLGSSGSALVGELLSKSEDTTVLAIEAGSLPDSRIDDPNQSLSLWNSEYNWKDNSTAQVHLNNRTFLYTSGKGAGGSSLLNGTVWVHGRKADYKRWEDAGNKGWGPDEMLTILRELENYVDRPSVWRGKSGPIMVHGMNSLSPFSLDFVRSLESFGIPYVEDYNDQRDLGVSFAQQNATLDNERVHAFKTFIAPHITDGRLQVLSNKTVEKVLFDNKRAVGVRYRDSAGNIQEAFASRYVVLSAGAFRSPQLLMLSGIGPQSELTAHGIDTLVDLPGVGENLQDHPTCVVAREVNLTYPLKRTMQNIGFFDFTESAQPKFKMQTYHIRNYPPYDPNSFGIGVELQHPKSRGNVRLRSRNINDAPLINPNVFDDAQDVTDIVDGLKQAWAWLEHFDKHSSWFSSGRLPRQEDPSDKDFEEFARAYTFPDFHPSGTCKMGPASDSMAVVDYRLNVKGVTGLKVADASIMPELPSGNIYATTLAIGVKAARFILDNH